MKLLKDLLYTTGNQALDIARVCSIGSVISFWVAVFMGRVTGDALAIGGGCAAIFGGAAAWIYARQTKETSPAAGSAS